MGFCFIYCNSKSQIIAVIINSEYVLLVIQVVRLFAYVMVKLQTRYVCLFKLKIKIARCEIV